MIGCRAFPLLAFFDLADSGACNLVQVFSTSRFYQKCLQQHEGQRAHQALHALLPRGDGSPLQPLAAQTLFLL